MDGVADVISNGKSMAQLTYSLVLDDFGVYNSSTTVEITSLNVIQTGILYSIIGEFIKSLLLSLLSV